MTERTVLVAAVVLLVAGLGTWAYVARERGGVAGPEAAPRPRPSEIGEPIVATDPDARSARGALEEAVLAPVPISRLFVRGTEPIHAGRVPGRDAVAIWERLRGMRDASHLYPVLLGDGWSALAHAHRARTTTDAPEDVLRRAARVDLATWMQARLATLELREGEWPEGLAPEERWASVRDEGIGLFLPEVVVVLLPIAEGAEAPAWLAFGNFAGCPEPALHVAMLRHLEERWGAEVVAITDRAIELRVARPPATHEAAVELARELVAYTPNLADEGRRSLSAIAAPLVGAPRVRITF